VLIERRIDQSDGAAQLVQRLDDRGLIPDRAGFSHRHNVQTGSGAHPFFCPMVTGVLSPGGKAAGA
jgi:hypothetical protein